MLLVSLLLHVLMLPVAPCADVTCLLIAPCAHVAGVLVASCADRVFFSLLFISANNSLLVAPCVACEHVPLEHFVFLQKKFDLFLPFYCIRVGKLLDTCSLTQSVSS